MIDFNKFRSLFFQTRFWENGKHDKQWRGSQEKDNQKKHEEREKGTLKHFKEYVLVLNSERMLVKNQAYIEVFFKYLI